jgi:hypothetical protein
MGIVRASKKVRNDAPEVLKNQGRSEQLACTKGGDKKQNFW